MLQTVHAFCIFAHTKMCSPPTCHSATSCVRGQNTTTAPARHIWETASLNQAQIMLRWLLDSPNSLNLVKVPLHLENNSIRSPHHAMHWFLQIKFIPNKNRQHRFPHFGLVTIRKKNEILLLAIILVTWELCTKHRWSINQRQSIQRGLDQSQSLVHNNHRSVITLSPTSKNKKNTNIQITCSETFDVTFYISLLFSTKEFRLSYWIYCLHFPICINWWTDCTHNIGYEDKRLNKLLSHETIMNSIQFSLDN